MRHLLLTLFILLLYIAKGQPNNLECNECYIELCHPKNFDLEERTSGKPIDLLHYYKFPNDEKDTLKVVNFYKIQFLENGVIKIKMKRNKSNFWKTEHYIFDHKGYVWQCKKNGKLKFDSIIDNNKKTEFFKIGNDSIKVVITYWYNTKDSPCMYLDKYVYRNGILIEKWHKYSPFDGCDWKTGKYEIQTYTYLNKNQKRIDYSSSDKFNNLIKEDYYRIITYDDLGKFISSEKFKLSNPNEVTSGYYHIYKDGKLKELKYVENSEIIELYSVL